MSRPIRSGGYCCARQHARQPHVFGDGKTSVTCTLCRRWHRWSHGQAACMATTNRDLAKHQETCLVEPKPVGVRP